MIRQSATLVRSGIAILLMSALLTSQVALAQTPDASPAADSRLPEGSLGEQIQWVFTTLNSGASDTTADQVSTHLTPDFIAQVPAAQLIAIFGQLHGQLGPATIEADSLITTRDLPPTNARFVLVGETGLRLDTSITIDRESGKISDLLFQPAPATPAASPAATPVIGGVTDKDVSFQSGQDTIHGSFMQPDGATEPLPGALIISGSGPTDRNGNSPSLPSMNTNLNLAGTLAHDGVASLRYDKLGSGQTGLGTHANGEGIDYELFLQEARDALTFLTGQPHVDSSKLILVGHSEGALFALVLAQELTAAGTPPAAVILVSPLSIRYLDLLEQQITPQITNAVESGQITQQEADTAKQELTAIIKSLRDTGALPSTITSPVLQQLFSPSNAAFLAQIDKIDPGTIAAELPATTPVLVLHGTKDQQVTDAQVHHLMAGFEKAGNTHASLVELTDANHLLKIITGTPNASVDYANPNLPFAPEAIEAIGTFLDTQGLSD